MKNNKNKFFKLLAFIAAAGTVAAAAAGCGNTQTSTDSNSLTYWVRLHPNIGTSVTNLGETPFAKAYSEKTAADIDAEVKHIMTLQYQKTEQILTENMAVLTRVAEKLLEKETIDGQEFEECFNI